jgi:hypothetical protein
LRENLANHVKVVGHMSFLTQQQREVLCIVALLLLTGLAVKAYRAAHPPVSDKPAPVATK